MYSAGRRVLLQWVEYSVILTTLIFVEVVMLAFVTNLGDAKLTAVQCTVS